jgi:hypothetical protein
MVRSKSLGEIQTMMNKVGQDFQTAKNKAETLAARPQRPIIAQDEEGKPIYVSPSTGEPMLGADGKPMRPAPTGRAPAEKPLMPSAAERKNYVGLSQMATTSDELIEKLKDPSFAAKVDKYRLSAFLSEEGGKIASQVLREKIPDDVQDFINKATRLRNQYYLEISGKAVTGGEAMRNYNVVPQPGMNAMRLRQTLESLRDGARGDVDEFRKMYPKLPDLTKGGTTVRTVPEQQRAYAVGELIESGGKKYRALTAGTDPDVEEIK